MMTTNTTHELSAIQSRKPSMPAILSGSQAGRKGLPLVFGKPAEYSVDYIHEDEANQSGG
jgi:hypothetical protein